ncbi:MAG: hypothetical protein NZM94_09705, partial [Roseiflexus sp.]|nr:hypothetical protein [Roseiflexus sp.]
MACPDADGVPGRGWRARTRVARPHAGDTAPGADGQAGCRGTPMACPDADGVPGRGWRARTPMACPDAGGVSARRGHGARR